MIVWFFDYGNLSDDHKTVLKELLENGEKEKMAIKSNFRKTIFFPGDVKETH